MAAALVVYFLLLIALGIYSARQIGRGAGGFRDFLIAGGRQGVLMITFSILASVVGGSATFGVMDLAAKVGFPAFWWLGVGSLGLLAQAAFLTRRVRGLDAGTLPHVAALTMGGRARLLIAAVIVVSWLGIVAGQFTALFGFVSSVPGFDTPWARFALAAVIIFYTAAGGQLSVIRTDLVQFGVILAGVGLTCLCLFGGESGGPGFFGSMEFLNGRFGSGDLLHLGLIAGAAFFIGPDVMTRALAARDGTAARRAVVSAAVLLAVFAAAMASIGVWAVSHGIKGSGGEVLASLVTGHLPRPVGMLLSLGLISALVSSVDTCIMSAASIIEYDIVRGESTARLRCFVTAFGLAAYAIAIFRADIIGLLVSAYSVYTPGVVIPLFFAVMAHGRMRLNRAAWYAAVFAGGAIGLAGGIMQMKSMALWGMGAALVLSLVSLAAGSREESAGK